MQNIIYNTMKANLYIKMLLCCPLLFTEACSDDDDKPQKSTNVSVVSFNIRVDNPVDGDNVWENRKAAAVAMIESEQPTLLGLQEAQPHQITYLAKNCPDYAWYGLGRDTGECPPETDSYAAEECMAISLNVPVVCLCQLSRKIEDRQDKKPQLSDLRDSGAIEQDADGVLFLYREDYYTGPSAKGAPSDVTLTVAKNRHGRTGEDSFRFWLDTGTFRETPA